MPYWDRLYAGHCPCCGKTTLAPVPDDLEPGTPFSLNIVALAMYLRFVHHVSSRRLSRLLLEWFGLVISGGCAGRRVPARHAVL
jgi:transposase